MYLSSLEIKNFRLIEHLKLEFNKDINVLIGENNSGKSSIIDAIRICLGYGKQLRDIGVKISDFYIDRKSPVNNYPPIEFHLYFDIENDYDERYFYEMIHQDSENESLQEIQMHFRYYIEKKDDKEIIRWKVWGGTNEGQPINFDALRFIDYTYLDALRDATQKLKPYGYQNKLAQLFENLVSYKSKDGSEIVLDKDKKRELAKRLEDWLKDGEDKFGNEWKYLILEGKTNVNEHLNKAEIEDDKIPIDIAFSGYEFKDVVNNLQIRLPVFNEIDINESEQRYFNISQNGLGQNNLIYAATVLGDLLSRKSKGYYHALLIEEPEAHLHPQKQNTFFRYLNDLKEKDIQIFITSHSPTITAKTELDFVTILQKQNDLVTSLSLKKSSLSDANRVYLSKFLDVTKSQLFFAKGVILVEGISEALLFPILSKIIGFDLEKNGIEVVNVGGTSFEHFINLFIAEDLEKQKRLNSYCAIITDDDSHRYGGEKSDRAKIVEELCRDKDRVISCLARKTFEYEMFIASKVNARILRYVYEKMHTRLKLMRDGNNLDQGQEFLEEIDKKKDKSELAQRLSLVIEKYYKYCKRYRNGIVEFKVPEYIERGIKWVINGTRN